MKKIKKILLSIFLPVVMILTAGILSFASITETAHALSGNGGGFFVGSNTTLNFNATISGSSATNGGGVYVANGGTFNMNGGSISGNTATDGGGVYVANGGTFNMNGGSISGNKATNNGDSIYNNGTFIMTGGTLGETNGVAWVYCDRNAVTQIYGGTVHDNFYMYSNLQTKMGTTINGKIFLAETSTITVQDYAGTTPEYNIEVSSSRQSGTIVTFKGSTIEPALSKINVTGYDSESYAVKTKKDSSGNWTISLVENSYDFPSDWKTQVASTTYMTTTVTPANLTSIKFAPTVPSGYSQIGTLSTGLPVYKGTKATEIAFVGKKIFAPADSSQLFYNLSKLTTLDMSVFNTSNVTNMNNMFGYCSALTSLNLSSFNMAKVTNSGNMLNFGASNKILTLKTPYNNSTAIAITTGSTLYNVSTGASATGVPANTTTSQTYATKVTLTFDANGGTCSTSSIVGYYGCSLSEIGKSLPTPTQSGYNFNGWYSPTGSRVTASTVLAFTSSTTLTARWTEITTPDPDPPTPPDPDPPTPTNSDIEDAEYIVFTTRSGVPSGFSENNTFNYTRTNGNTFFETGCTPTVYTNESGTQVAFVGNGGELVAPTDCTGLFSNMVNLKWVIFRNYDTFNSTNFTSMFEDCGSLEFVDLLTFQTPNVESMACMFKNCPLLKQVAKADFDCINLASASEMFNGCTSLGTSYVYGPGNTASFVGVLPDMKYTYNLANADLMFANSGVTGFSMSYFFTNNLSSASGMFDNCNITYLDLSAWVDNYGFTSGLFDSGAAPVVVYTPRRCNPSTFMSQFTGGSYEYSLAGGESSDIFDQLGLQDFLSPISFCFVRSDKTSDYTAYTFNLDVDYCGNDDLAELIKKWGDGVSDPQSSTFYSNGQLRGISFKTYGKYSYYVLPASFIVYTNNSSAEESELAGWIADDSFGDEGTLDGLTYGSFLSLSDIWSSGGNGAVLRSVRWRDEMVSNPNYDSSADVPNAIDTPYSNWFGDQRHLHARVRYLPSVHGTQGNIFKGWGPGPNGEILGYFTNIVPISNNGDYWWTDGFSPCWEDIENIIRNDYWSFPTDSASFVSIVENSSFENSSKSDSEINLEELMEIYQKSKQHVLIPEDKKVTITELKLKKVS